MLDSPIEEVLGAEDSKVDGDSATKTGKRTLKGRRLGRKERVVHEGRVYINATFNNTLITITDPQGATLSWWTPTKCGYRGAKKSTSYAAKEVALRASREAKERFFLHSVDVYVKGPGQVRDSAIRAVSAELRILSISDISGLAHNGPKAPKKRRV